MITSPGTLLFHIVPGILLLFAIICLVLGIRERKWFNMGITFLIAAGVTGYLIPTILHNMGIHVTTKIPQVNYTLSSRLIYLTNITTVPVNTSKCFSVPGHSVVTINGPNLYRTYTIANGGSLCFNFTRPGVYTMTIMSNVSNSIILEANTIIVGERSANWLQESILNLVTKLVTNYLTANPLLGIFFNSGVGVYGTFGLDYMFLTPMFALKSTYNLVFHAVIGVALLALAIDAAYIAFESRDPLDFLLNFCYDFGIWALGTFYGYAIFNIIAGFLNYIVLTCFNVPSLITYMYELILSSIAMLIGITIIDVLVFSTSFTSARLLIYIGLLAILFTGVFRVVLIQALLTLLPLIMAMWVLPPTRKIANTLLMTLAWATLGGVVNAAIITALMKVLSAKLALLIISAILPIVQLGLLYTLLTIRKEFGAKIKRRL